MTENNIRDTQRFKAILTFCFVYVVSCFVSFLFVFKILCVVDHF